MCRPVNSGDHRVYWLLFEEGKIEETSHKHVWSALQEADNFGCLLYEGRGKLGGPVGAKHTLRLLGASKVKALSQGQCWNLKNFLSVKVYSALDHIVHLRLRLPTITVISPSGNDYNGPIVSCELPFHPNVLAGSWENEFLNGQARSYGERPQKDSRAEMLEIAWHCWRELAHEREGDSILTQLSRWVDLCRGEKLKTWARAVIAAWDEYIVEPQCQARWRTIRNTACEVFLAEGRDENMSVGELNRGAHDDFSDDEALGSYYEDNSNHMDEESLPDEDEMMMEESEDSSSENGHDHRRLSGGRYDDYSSWDRECGGTEDSDNIVKQIAKANRVGFYVINWYDTHYELAQKLQGFQGTVISPADGWCWLVGLTILNEWRQEGYDTMWRLSDLTSTFLKKLGSEYQPVEIIRGDFLERYSVKREELGLKTGVYVEGKHMYVSLGRNPVKLPSGDISYYLHRKTEVVREPEPIMSRKEAKKERTNKTEINRLARANKHAAQEKIYEDHCAKLWRVSEKFAAILKNHITDAEWNTWCTFIGQLMAWAPGRPLPELPYLVNIDHSMYRRIRKHLIRFAPREDYIEKSKNQMYREPVDLSSKVRTEMQAFLAQSSTSGNVQWFKNNKPSGLGSKNTSDLLLRTITFGDIENLVYPTKIPDSLGEMYKPRQVLPSKDVADKGKHWEVVRLDNGRFKIVSNLTANVDKSFLTLCHNLGLGTSGDAMRLTCIIDGSSGHTHGRTGNDKVRESVWALWIGTVDLSKTVVYSSIGSKFSECNIFREALSHRYSVDWRIQNVITFGLQDIFDRVWRQASYNQFCIKDTPVTESVISYMTVNNRESFIEEFKNQARSLSWLVPVGPVDALQLVTLHDLLWIMRQHCKEIQVDPTELTEVPNWSDFAHMYEECQEEQVNWNNVSEILYDMAPLYDSFGFGTEETFQLRSPNMSHSFFTAGEMEEDAAQVLPPVDLAMAPVPEILLEAEVPADGEPEIGNAEAGAKPMTKERHHLPSAFCDISKLCAENFDNPIWAEIHKAWNLPYERGLNGWGNFLILYKQILREGALDAIQRHHLSEPVQKHNKTVRYESRRYGYKKLDTRSKCVFQYHYLSLDNRDLLDQAWKDIKPFYYHAVRPADSGYNNLYIAQNKNKSSCQNGWNKDNTQWNPICMVMELKYWQNSSLNYWMTHTKTTEFKKEFQWFIEMNDCSYYLPYFKFPDHSMILCSSWQYQKVNTEEPAFYGEGSNRVGTTKWEDLCKIFSTYHSWQMDWEGLEQDMPWISRDTDTLQTSKKVWLKIDKSHPGYNLLRPLSVSNRASGAWKSYDSYNTYYEYSEKFFGLGHLALAGFVGFGSDFRNRVHINMPIEECEKFSIASLYEYIELNGAKNTPTLSYRAEKLKIHWTNYNKWLDRCKKQIESYYNTGFWSGLLGNGFNLSQKKNLIRCLACVFRQKARGLVITHRKFWGNIDSVITLDATGAQNMSAWHKIKGAFKSLGDNLSGNGIIEWNPRRITQTMVLDERSKVHIALGSKYSEPLVITPEFFNGRNEIESLLVEKDNRICKALKNIPHKKLMQSILDSNILDVVKTRLVEAPEAIPEPTHYKSYHVKPYDPEEVLPIEHNLLRHEKNTNWKKKREILCEIAKEAIKESLTQKPRQKPAWNTGYSVRNENGQEVLPFEWCSKNTSNLIWAAFGRQLGSRNTVSPANLAGYVSMMKEISEWLQRTIDQQQSREDLIKKQDILDWLKSHTEWSKAKKAKYLASILKQVHDPLSKNYIGAFKGMVKNGEEYVTHKMKLVANVLEGEASRPRMISDPSWQYCGLATYLQNDVVFPLLKRAVPGFVHGVSCHDLAKKFEKNISHINVNGGYKSVSFDGAAFDANQHQCLQEATDSVVWFAIKPHIKKRIQHWSNSDQILSCLETFWCRYEADWFLTSVDFKDKFDQPEHELRQYRRCWTDGQACSSVKVTLSGSTFSGHPTLTTLGNTWRSLCYMWYYQQESGIHKPWQTNVWVTSFASGDDSVMIVHPHKVNELVDTLKKLTAKDKKTPGIGLGQCIDNHTIFVNDWRNFDFCSKWCFFDGKQWLITRDYSKTLWNKQAYVGENHWMQADPDRHIAAILGGLKAEGLQDSLLYVLTEARLTNPASDELINKAREVWLKDHSWDIHYENHDVSQENLKSVDKRLGLTWSKVAQTSAKGILCL